MFLDCTHCLATDAGTGFAFGKKIATEGTETQRIQMNYSVSPRPQWQNNFLIIKHQRHNQHQQFLILLLLGRFNYPRLCRSA